MNRNSYAPAVREIVENLDDVSTEDLILSLGMHRYERSQTASTSPLHQELRLLADSTYVAIKERAPKGVAVKAHYAARRFAKGTRDEDEFREEAAQIAALFNG